MNWIIALTEPHVNLMNSFVRKWGFVHLRACVFNYESHQDEQAVRGEFLMSRDGGKHGKNQTSKHQDEPVENKTFTYA